MDNGDCRAVGGYWEAAEMIGWDRIGWDKIGLDRT